MSFALVHVLRITNGFEKMSDAKLLLTVRNIITKLTGNANFPATTPTLAEVTTMADAFTASSTNAINGGKEDKDIRDADKAQLVQMLHRLGNSILVAANSDRAIAETSGFTISKLPTPRGPVEPARHLRLQAGLNRGELQFSFLAQPSALVYLYSYTADPASAEQTWTSFYDSSSRVSFAGLQSGVQYSFKVAVIGRNRLVVESDVVSSYVM